MNLHIVHVHPAASFLALIEHPTQISPASVAGFVRIVDGRRDADAGRGFAVQIAQVVRYTLQVAHGVLARLSEDFVQQDKVVGWACCPGERCMRLEEEVPVAVLGDAVVDKLSDSQPLSQFFTFRDLKKKSTLLTVPHGGLPCFWVRKYPLSSIR